MTRDVTYVPPTEEPFRTMPGTDLLTAKLASQSAEVEIETPTGISNEVKRLLNNNYVKH